MRKLKITAIEYQKKNKNRVNIYSDGEYFISLHIDLIYKHRISVGDEIEEDQLTKIIKDDDFERAKIKALNSISRTSKSEKKIREKLAEEFDEEIIDRVVDLLKKYEYLDDEKFAQQIVNNDLNFKKIGKNRIKQNLYSKGIQREDIESVISTVDKDVEIENAIILAKKRLPKIKEKDERAIRNKLYQHLAYKGFDYDTINTAIREVLK